MLAGQTEWGRVLVGQAWPAAVVAYLAGAIPFGVILAKLHGVDLRKAGSGNVGATNVGRTLGRKWGYLCFFLDMAKGLIPTLLAGWWIGTLTPGAPNAAQQVAWLAAGAGCVLGHVFPVWLRFRGGKGVATSLGVVLGIWPYFTIAGLIAFTLWVIVTLLSRYVSLGSILAALLFVPLFAAINGLYLGWDAARQLWPMGAFATVMSVLVIVRHRTNIRRLLAGTENPIGRKKTEG